MKQFVCLVLLLNVLNNPLTAQIESMALKSAANSLKSFQIDSTRTRKLLDARTAIDLAMRDSAVTKSAYFWLTRGEIYKNIAYELAKRRKQRKSDSLKLPPLKENPYYQAFKAFMNAYQRAASKADSTTAVAGIEHSTQSLNMEGLLAFNAGKFDQSYELYKGVLDGKNLFRPRSETGLSMETNYEIRDQEFLTARAAYQGGMIKQADSLFRGLYQVNYRKPLVYEALYKMETANKEVELDESYVYIERGRELLPDNPLLLEMQISHLEKTGRFKDLVEVLIPEIEKDAFNLSLKQIIGYGYDQLFQQAVSENKRKPAIDYFNEAKTNYLEVLKAQPDNFEVQFWMGELYSNRSALATRYLVELSSDFSEEGMNKYDQVKTQVYEFLDQALPYLQKAESIRPNDTGTLIALREVYARQDNEKMVSEFKSRLQTIMGGGRNESYFKM